MAHRTYPKAAEREQRTAPHAPLKEIRAALGLTMDQVIERMAEHDVALTRASLSAIEHGHRGASVDTLRALSLALGMGPDALTVDYTPRERREVSAA